MAESTVDPKDTPVEEETSASGKAGRLNTAREKLRKTASELQEQYGEISGDVRRGAQRAAEEIRRSTTQAVAGARRTVEQASSTARDRYHEAAQSVREGYGRLSHDARSVSDDLDEYVRQNPGKSLLIATGIGFLVGLLVRWSHDR